jgi:hypothetical protein
MVEVEAILEDLETVFSICGVLSSNIISEVEATSSNLISDVILLIFLLTVSCNLSLIETLFSTG